MRQLPLLALTSALALLVTGPAASPASASPIGTRAPLSSTAAEHPTVFTFTAHRTSGDLVAFSGVYAAWDDEARAYVAADDGVTIDDALPGTDSWREITDAATDDAGHFSGTEHVRPARQLRASDAYGPDPAAVSATQSVGYFGPLVASFSSVQAYRPTGSGHVRISGVFGGWAAYESCRGGDATGPRGGLTEYRAPTTRLVVQAKVGGRWKTIATTVTDRHQSGRFAVSITRPAGTGWRVVQRGDANFTAGMSAVVRASGGRFTGR